MITRRRFLSLAALATLAVACKGKVTAGVRTLRDVVSGRPQSLELIQVGTELLPERAERFAFGLVDPKTQLLIDGTGQMWAAPDTGPEAKAIGPFAIVHHGDGLPENRGYFEAQATFPTAGNWQVIVEARPGGKGDLIIGGPSIVKVGVATDMPKVGDSAISIGTPTTKDGRGVDPICTRRPACSMHDISLDEALASNKPVVVIFGTPAFCTSQLCGPEVDLLQDVAAENAGKAHFIHVELYRDDEEATVRAQIRAPAPLAWKVVEEPATYFIGADQVIKERLLGPADRASFRDATAALLA